MKAAWWTKLVAVGGVATGIAAASAVPACTVSSSSGDGGTTIEDDTGTGVEDGGTTDTSTGDTGTCVGACGCPAIGPTAPAISFGTSACDTCMSQNCCAQTTTCFTSPDGGTSDCDALHTCIRGCETNDAGTDCINTCKDVHSAQSATDQAAFETCYVNSCRGSGACP